MSNEQLIQDPEEIRLTDRQEVEAIMGSPPGFLLRSGNLLFMGGITIILLLGFYLPYPDVVQSKIKILSDSPPVRLAPLISGKIVHLEKNHLDEVNAGDLIGIMENPADWADVFEVEKALNNLMALIEQDDLVDVRLPQFVNLGQFQSNYSNLLNGIEAHKLFEKNDRTSRRIRRLKNQIKGIEKLNIQLENDEVLLNQSLDKEESKYKRRQQELEDGNISKYELEDAEISYLDAQRKYQAVRKEIYSNEIQVEEIQKNILELKQLRSDQSDKTYLGVLNSLQNVKGDIETWKSQYLITSPATGKLSMPNILSENQYVNRGEIIMTVIPEHSNIYGRADLGQENFGKIEYNDSVKIWLSGYPYQEYGAVVGVVSNINSLPENSLYRVDIELLPSSIKLQNDSLFIESTFNKDLLVRQEMEGLGNIITDKKTFLARVFDKLRSTWKNQ